MSIAHNNREAIVEQFNLSSPEDDKVISECQEVCRVYNITPINLFYKWEALQFNASSKAAVSPHFNMDAVGALKAQMQRELAATSSMKKQARGGPPQRFGPGAQRPRQTLTGMANKAVSGAASSGGLKGLSAVKQESGASAGGQAAVQFVDLTPKDASHRYMFESLNERGNALDGMLDELALVIKEHYNLDDISDPSLSTEGTVTTVGRIAEDWESASTSDLKLLPATMVIEPSRGTGSGVRVPLRFADDVRVRGAPKGAGGIGVFPGAVVGLRGKNGGGDWFLVEEMLAMPPLKPPVKSSIPSAAPSMAIACGPYTAAADLDFKPWKNLLSRLIAERPKVVLLIGPFIDLNHGQMRDGNIDKSLDEMFEDIFLNPIVREFLATCSDSTVLLLPSVLDAISSYAVFPQAPFELGAHHPRIHLLANPSTFSLNGTTIAASSVDVLFHLGKQEHFFEIPEASDEAPPSGDEVKSDPTARRCRHLLQQRSFYPIYPVPPEVSNHVNLDLTHRRALKTDDSAGVAREIFITPSQLWQFCKMVDSTLFINPGQVMKGSYALGQLGQTLDFELKKLD